MLKTKRLTLRAPRADDLDAMFAAFSHPRAMRFWSTPPHDDPALTKDLLDRWIARWAHHQINFQIDLNGRYIGNAGNFESNEIGFMLHPDYWRQGYVSEAMRAIIPHLWDVTDHDRLTADVDPDNTASLALLTSLGFVETHRAQNTFCLAGVWAHSVYLALPRPRDPVVK